MTAQFVDYICTHGALIYYCDEGRSEFDVGDVLCYIAAHSSVHFNNMTGIAAARNVLSVRISFDINKCSSYYYYTCVLTVVHFLLRSVISVIQSRYSSMIIYCYYDRHERFAVLNKKHHYKVKCRGFRQLYLLRPKSMKND
jgi:hypothetical protein